MHNDERRRSITIEWLILNTMKVRCTCYQTDMEPCYRCETLNRASHWFRAEYLNAYDEYERLGKP